MRNQDILGIALSLLLVIVCGVILYYSVNSIIDITKNEVVITATEKKQETQQPEKVEVLEKEPVETSGQQIVSLGMFTATAYCKENYPHICNNGNATSTATGTTPTVGRTIAVDPSIIPLGSKVIIEGDTFVAEDTGNAIKGKKIDILLNSHEEALQYGRQTVEVFIMK